MIVESEPYDSLNIHILYKLKCISKYKYISYNNNNYYNSDYNK